MTSLRLSPAAIVGLLAAAALPLLVRLIFPSSEKYYLHLLIQILIWSFIYTGWSLMGRFGLTSLGHGAFTGIGAYATVLLWNFGGITPWIDDDVQRATTSGFDFLMACLASGSTFTRSGRSRPAMSPTSRPTLAGSTSMPVPPGP